jgi:hypothetical protein
MLWSGELAWRCGPREASSEAENRLRGRDALEGGGDSPEGELGPQARRRSHGAAPGPRARPRLARGVPRPIVWWAVVFSWVMGPSLFWVAATQSVS